MRSLTWTVDEAGYRFEVREGGTCLPFACWAAADCRRASDGGAAVLAPLLRLEEAETVGEDESKGVTVPHGAVAALEPAELRGLGLPRQAPFAFELGGEGLVTDAEFQFRCNFVHPRGRPVMGWVCDKSVLRVGEEQYVLPEPYYSLLEAVGAFNVMRGRSSDERLAALADIQALLPADARVGDYFREMRIVRADTFSLQPYINAAGAPDFEPVLGRAAAPETVGEEEEGGRVAVLPEQPLQRWQRFFRELPRVRRSYAAGAGWYVVVSPRLQAALGIAKHYQAAAPDERRAFLRNPRPFLQGPEMAEADANALFWESAEYSARIRSVGVWSPRVIPYVRPSGQEWLPPAEAGLRIGEDALPLTRKEVAALRGQVERALEGGAATVRCGTMEVPATQETLEALTAVERLVEAPSSAARQEHVAGPQKIALLIHDNLDELGYVPPPRTSAAAMGMDPAVLATPLLPHQRDGCLWLQEAWANGGRGGLLADDMGLGKTLQALAFLAWLREQEAGAGRTHRPILIVGPTGLLKTWRAEHDQHLSPPGLGDVLEVHGAGLRNLRLPQAARVGELGGGFPVLSVEQLQEADWVLTTFETLRDYQHSFGRVHWLAVVFDEAQKIKNPAALMTDAAKAMNADFTLALTGTPVENSLADLWSIVDTVAPGALGSLKEFMGTYDRAEDRLTQLQRLKALLLEAGRPPLVQRRMKDVHLKGLPAIRYHPLRRPMPQLQAREYAAAVEQARRGAGRTGNMLGALQRLRAISLHPQARGDESDGVFVAASARVSQCFEILDGIRERKQKALLFLDNLSVQAQLAEVIQRRYQLTQPPLIINGAVAGPKRQDRVDVFQNRKGFDVMVLSPRAGGVGLTLTAANHVIHLGRWWNPAVEDQCTDRVYRIGQRREVEVYFPMAIHPEFGAFSFDERLHALLENKRVLSRTVLAPVATSEAELEALYAQTVQMTPS